MAGKYCADKPGMDATKGSAPKMPFNKKPAKTTTMKGGRKISGGKRY